VVTRRRRIAFTRVNNSREAAVFIVNLNGTGLRRLTPWKLDAASPDWSPNGRTILFATTGPAARQAGHHRLDPA
jgi:Tol biopolymer transport system component